MIYQLTQTKLDKLRHLLQQLELWSLQSPSAEALASSAPFACDVMPLEQWLQFIFLPKMQLLVDSQQPLPTKIAIAPMAHHLWQNQLAYSPLINLINELDMLLNDAS